MMLRSSFLKAFCLLWTFPAFAQFASGLEDDYSSLDSSDGSTIPPIYSTLNEKRFYHARQIHGMKKDLNDHSRNLYDLRRRFDQAFFGKNSAVDRSDPFLVGPEPRLPVAPDSGRRVRYVPPSPPPEPPASVPYFFPEENNQPPPQPIAPISEENLLAFNVQAPGTYLSHDNQLIAPPPSFGFSPGQEVTSSTSGRFEYYFLPRGSIAYPYRMKKNQGNPLQPHYQRYDPGFSAGLSGGIRTDRWRIGIAGVHQENKLHADSWAASFGTTWPKYDWSGKTTVTAALLEVSHLVPLWSSLKLSLGGGCGHAWTRSNYEFTLGANSVSSSRSYGDFIWSAGTGLEWSFSQSASLILSYRYFASEEVPTHNADLGLEIDF